MNQDESLKCLRLSKDYLKKGERDKAEKFARKAIALNDTDEAQKWLKSLLSKPYVKSDKNSNKEDKPNIPSASESRPYTEIQVQTIKTIIHKKSKGDLYGILNLEKDATDVDIKKAYRKLALLCHPGNIIY
jgi:DnaJ family protein B protein 12